MISGVFGLPGAGKTVFLAKCAQKALDRKPMVIGGHYLHYGNYDAVLTNFYCKGCAKFDFSQLGKVDFRNCLLICDETAIEADSRSFKTFSEEAKFFFHQGNRKAGNCFIWTSQSYDSVDKRIRDLTDNYYYIRPSRILGSKMSTILPIDPCFDIVQGKPCTYYDFAPPTAKGHIWLPKYWNLIDTAEYIKSRQLTKMQLTYWDDCDIIKIEDNSKLIEGSAI